MAYSKETGYHVKDLPGISEWDVGKLLELRIKRTGSFLNAAKSWSGRSYLSKQTQISMQQLLVYANTADLLRIQYLGLKYVPVLSAVGCNTVRELKNRNPINLHDAVSKRCVQMGITPPARNLVASWIGQAHTLELMITY